MGWIFLGLLHVWIFSMAFRSGLGQHRHPGAFFCIAFFTLSMSCFTLLYNCILWVRSRCVVCDLQDEPAKILVTTRGRIPLACVRHALNKEQDRQKNQVQDRSNSRGWKRHSHLAAQNDCGRWSS